MRSGLLQFVMAAGLAGVMAGGLATTGCSSPAPKTTGERNALSDEVQAVLDTAQSKDPTACFTATNNYLDCHESGYPDEGAIPACEDDGRYADRSPIHWYDYSTGVPIFFANGGAGSAGPELIGIQEARDFNGRFPAPPVTPHQKCEVDTDNHASNYLSQLMWVAATGGKLLEDFLVLFQTLRHHVLDRFRGRHKPDKRLVDQLCDAPLATDLLVKHWQKNHA